MRDKKGLTVEQFVLIALAVFVLVIIALVASFGYDRVASTLGFLPDSFEGEEFEEPEVFRYSIPLDRVEYFTGSDGREIRGDEIVNGKRVNGDALRDSFVAFYYNSEREARDVILSDNSGNSFYPNRDVGRLKARLLNVVGPGDTEGLGRAYVSVVLRSMDTSVLNSFGNVLVKFDGTYFVEGTSQFEDINSETTIDHLTIVLEATDWRDSVLSERMGVVYDVEVARGKWVSRSQEVNVKKNGDYLVIDLEGSLLV
jgi:hypothetical protein